MGATPSFEIGSVTIELGFALGVVWVVASQELVRRYFANRFPADPESPYSFDREQLPWFYIVGILVGVVGFVVIYDLVAFLF